MFLIHRIDTMKIDFLPAFFLFSVVLPGLSACNQTGEGAASAGASAAQEAAPARAGSNTDFPGLDDSPMDMAYYPGGYSMAKVKGNAGPLIARVIYSRPQKKGREIFGKLIPYGEIWRLGANQATELDVYSPVTVGGHQVNPGRYTLYAIPQPDKWTVILSGQTDTWGAFGYKEEEDILRTDVPAGTLTDPVEAFTMVFKKAAQGCDLLMAWDKTVVKLPIGF